MTDGERAVWAAVYAAHVHSPQLRGFDQPTPERVTRAAAKAATIAVERLRAFAAAAEGYELGDLAVDQAREVLR